MATFLTTRRHALVTYTGSLMQAAGELILISPYIDADDETRNRLRDKAGNIAIDVVYRYKKSTLETQPNPR